MLSANNEAPLNVECIMDDIDVRGRLNREELEALVAPVLARLKAPMEKVSHQGDPPGISHTLAESSLQRRPGPTKMPEYEEACLYNLWPPSAVRQSGMEVIVAHPRSHNRTCSL